MNSNFDLHIHSTASDGTDTIEFILEKLTAAGIHTFSLTDHDTIEGAIAMRDLVPEHMHFIPGIEFSCTTSFKKCHILGYDFDSSDKLFQATLKLGKTLRQEKLLRRITFLEENFGIVLTEEERAWLHAQESPGKPSFGQILVARNMAPDIDTAIKKYINPCKVKNDRIDADIAIKAIVHAGGIPVWAHPLGGEGERRLTTEEFQRQLEELIADGIQGLECYYSRYSQDEIAFLLEQANAHNLLISGGSDYHGSNKKAITLGKLNKDNLPVDTKCVTLINMI